MTMIAALALMTIAACSDGEVRREVTEANPSGAPGGKPAPGVDTSRGIDTNKVIDTAGTASRDTAVPDEPAFPEIRYIRVALKNKKILDSIRKAYDWQKTTSPAHRAITTLNRKEFRYFRSGDTIVTPDTVIEDLRAYSVFPTRYPGAADIPKIIMVSNALQSYACYEWGVLVRFAAANTGSEKKPTFPGRYALNWKTRVRHSSLNHNWVMPYNWNFHLFAGNAFHEFDMPGRPVSHSCVRQFKTDAAWLFTWGEGGRLDSSGHVMHLTGVPVIITDIFDFTRKKGGPWLDLASNRDGILTLPEDPMAVEEALIPMSQIPREVRSWIPNRKRYLYAEDTLRARGIIREGVTLSASIDYDG